ncbi:hypothetical protein SAMN05216315_103110 [Nitrosospira sp. Nsp18]|jgi:hypothetical protein|nr:hypothetical protein SAMN05216315_103110 [Nitrosospira sp. Nsp18]
MTRVGVDVLAKSFMGEASGSDASFDRLAMICFGGHR